MNSKGKVIVIDDNEDLVELVEMTLSRTGYEVAHAYSGKEGVALAGAGGFDLVILDIMMPGMDGVTALKEIKKASPFIEVIMLTAHASLDTVVECMRTGAFDYITKPFTMDKLTATAEKALEKRRFSEVARAAFCSAGPNGLLETLINSACRLMGADEALLILQDSGEEPSLAACGGLADGDLKQARFDFCLSGIKALELAPGEARSAIPARSPALRDRPGAAGLAAAIWIPVAEGENLAGALCLNRLSGGAQFSDTELRRANIFGPLASLAIKKAELSGQLREVREQMVRTQKMEPLGLLAAQITHDFNNVLCVITSSIQLMMENMRPGVDLKLSEGILQMAREAEAMIGQLLRFARGKEGPAEPLDLNTAIDEIKIIIGKLPGKNISVEYRQDRGLPPVKVRPERFKQLVMNLAVNARNSMPGGGQVTVTTRRPAAGETLPERAGAADCVVLEVSDRGTGISPENLKRIFEPFFSTKPDGKGTGLGLHIVQCVVKDSGGTIRAENRPEGGAVFRVLLPAFGKETAPPPGLPEASLGFH